MLNSTVFHAQVSFSKTIKITRVRRTSAVWGFWKTHEWVFFQIARETMLLLMNNIHDKIMQNWVIHLRHVQNYSLQLSIFSERKSISQNDKSKTMYFNYKIVKISKIALYFLFWHCISFFGTVFPLNCTALSQSELRSFFSKRIKKFISKQNVIAIYCLSFWEKKMIWQNESIGYR